MARRCSPIDNLDIIYYCRSFRSQVQVLHYYPLLVMGVIRARFIHRLVTSDSIKCKLIVNLRLKIKT